MWPYDNIPALTYLHQHANLRQPIHLLNKIKDQNSHMKMLQL